MIFNNIHIIINPASGTDEPILSYLYRSLKDTDIHWEVTVLTPRIDVVALVKRLIGQVDLLVVYGGDGTVMLAAQALIGSDLPMAILPGGTANVMAKELGISTDTQEAIQMIVQGMSTVKKIDTGVVNGIPFLIRINFGIMADMVTGAARETKETLGQLAYGISAIENIISAAPKKYILTIDGEEIHEEGVSLTITNSGSIGIAGYSFLPDISIEDGLFDVILMDNADFLSVLRVAGSTLLQTESEVLKHWKCKEISVVCEEEVTYICDDMEMTGSTLSILMNPKSLHVLAPLPQQDL